MTEVTYFVKDTENPYSSLPRSQSGRISSSRAGCRNISGTKPTSHLTGRAKKPPTDFISREDWSLYLRVCCHIRQIKIQYGCNDAEAQSFVPVGHGSRRKGGCIIRLVAAFNCLYAEYSRLFDSQCLGGEKCQGSRTSVSHERTSYCERMALEKGDVATDEGCRNRTSRHTTSERRSGKNYEQTSFEVEHAENAKKRTAVAGDDQATQTAAEVVVNEKADSDMNTLINEKSITEGQESGCTVLNSASTSLHMTPRASTNSRMTTKSTQTVASKMVRRNSTINCFHWCYRPSSPRPASVEGSVRDRDTKGSSIGKNNGARHRSTVTDANRTVEEYYDQIQRFPLENTLVVYECNQSKLTIEHLVQVPSKWLLTREHLRPSGVLSGFPCGEFLTTTRLPIALELILPRMQRQIEAVMSVCRYVYDPLEVAAELRQTNYDTDACITYFNMTQTLRDIIHEFLPKKQLCHNSGAPIERNTCSPFAYSVGPNYALSRQPNGFFELSSSLLALMLDLQNQITRLKKSQADAARRLTKLRTFVIEVSPILSNMLAERLTIFAAKVTQANSLKRLNNNEIEPSTQHVTKLSQENNALKLTLKLEESRRKAVFNMMQEYLGNVRVYCRCRTIPQTTACLEVRTLDTIVLNAGQDGGIEQFKFERVFDSKASQAEVYSELAPSVFSFLDGYNVCFLTYGGEASGKTYTLLGMSNESLEHQGITQRAFRTVLNEREIRQHDWDYCLSVAAIEVYNDTLTDLISGEGSIHVRVDLGLEKMMDTLRTVPIQSETDIDHLLTHCRSRRRTGRTALNGTSSRSHLILLAHLRGKSLIHATEVQSVLALCDLAGFEDIIKADTLSDPTLAKEAGYINRSLTALNRVFMSLRTQDPLNVCYRDSKLTYLLKPFFTYSGKCILIVTVRMDRSSLASTQSTLRFGRESRGVSLGRARRQLSLDKLIDEMRAT